MLNVDGRHTRSFRPFLARSTAPHVTESLFIKKRPVRTPAAFRGGDIARYTLYNAPLTQRLWVKWHNELSSPCDSSTYIHSDQLGPWGKV